MLSRFGRNWYSVGIQPHLPLFYTILTPSKTAFYIYILARWINRRCRGWRAQYGKVYLADGSRYLLHLASGARWVQLIITAIRKLIETVIEFMTGSRALYNCQLLTSVPKSVLTQITILWLYVYNILRLIEQLLFIVYFFPHSNNLFFCTHISTWG